MARFVPLSYFGVIEVEAADGTWFLLRDAVGLWVDQVRLRDGSTRVLKNRKDARHIRVWLGDAGLFDSMALRHARKPGYVEPEQHLPH